MLEASGLKTVMPTKRVALFCRRGQATQSVLFQTAPRPLYGSFIALIVRKNSLVFVQETKAALTHAWIVRD